LTSTHYSAIKAKRAERARVALSVPQDFGGYMEILDNGAEGDVADCPHRVWFGDYALHYCDKDRELCKDVTQCNKKENKDNELS
jgi:hypothetical protein